MNSRKYIPTIIYFVVLVISLISNKFYGILIALLSLTILFSLIDKLGKGIILREAIALIYVFTCLVMPLLGYEVYNASYTLSRVFSKFMKVPSPIYYDFAFPAISAFCLSITWPFFKSKFVDEGPLLKQTLSKCKIQLDNDNYLGIIIICIGICSLFAGKYLSTAFQYVSTILFFSSFAGLLYIHFSPGFKNKKIIIGLFILFIVYNAIAIGMFTIVAYMSLTIFSFFFFGNNISLLRKIFFLLAGVFIIILIQNTKVAYRDLVWKKKYENDKTVLFGNLFIENLQKGDDLFDEKVFFPFYVRTNQGLIVSEVMRRIPVIKPFDKGNLLAKTLISSLVPRLLWPDKPEAGGKFNMEYYAGRKLRGVSMNVGPLGEAYGSFGVVGGILYMFILGILIRWAYGKVFLTAHKIPLIIFWIPVLFYQITYSAETDTLQIFNSFFKTAFFMWVLYKLLPRWFGKASERRNISKRLMAKTI